jgi:FMN phosphatase YigB (HAD superfamily)
MNNNIWYIFDCYGTLVHPIQNTGAKLLFSLCSEKERLKAILLTKNIPISTILNDYNDIDTSTKEKIITWFNQDKTALYDDAKRILDKCYIENIPFVILSNLSHNYMNDIEHLIGIPYADKRESLFQILYSCEIGFQKPQPEAYHLAIDFLEKTWVQKSHITMIWDNKKYDYDTPLNLGISALWLDRNNSNKDKSTKSIQDFDSIS